MSFNLKHTYTFDSFVLDVEEQMLLRDGRMVPLTPKVFETPSVACSTPGFGRH